MEFGDSRWSTLKGGYRVPYDPRVALRLLQDGSDDTSAWDELWENLYHQDDVDLASFAAVPHIVRIARVREARDWQFYALPGAIELRRAADDNPDLPDFLRLEYTSAWVALRALALEDLRADGPALLSRSALGVIALATGQRRAAQVMLSFEEDELAELLDNA